MSLAHHPARPLEVPGMDLSSVPWGTVSPIGGLVAVLAYLMRIITRGDWIPESTHTARVDDLKEAYRAESAAHAITKEQLTKALDAIHEAATREDLAVAVMRSIDKRAGAGGDAK